MDSHQAGLFGHVLLRSLKTISAVKTQFHSTTNSSTPAGLVSQIELCDVLLDELHAISRSLEKRVTGRGVTIRRSGVARLNLDRRRAVSRRKSDNRS